ncbi:hypothetical protein [Embleya sp. MST-111070]|uniref:hypothetical protein n=1 Tax=Embleya sp. MST-111070 TaxID=3398231 RepID=UPI003F73A9D9
MAKGPQREWHEAVDGNDRPWLGHDPQPAAERFGYTLRLTVRFGQSDSPVIELSASALGQLLVSVERDLTGFVARRPTGHPTTCPTTPPLCWPPSPACPICRRRPGVRRPQTTQLIVVGGVLM